MNAFSSLILFVFQGLQENSTSWECNVGTYFIFRDIRLKTPQKNFFSEPCNMQEAKKLFFHATQYAGTKSNIFFRPCRLQEAKKLFFHTPKSPKVAEK